MNKREGIFNIKLDEFELDLERLRRPKDVAVKKMAVSLKKRGQLTPVIVTESTHHFTLVDGFKRYRAAATLAMGSLKAVCIEADAKQAKAMMYLLNRSGSFSMIQEAVLVRELIDSEGLTQKEAAILLERHKSWISRRLEMVRRLAPEVIDDLLLELIPAGGGPSLARIPACNQTEFSETTQTHQLAPSEIRLLADMFCKAPDTGIKQTILRSPRTALELTKMPVKPKPVHWQGKIQTIFRLLQTLETDLKKKKISSEQKATLQNRMNRIKPNLCDILCIIEKESKWQN